MRLLCTSDLHLNHYKESYKSKKLPFDLPSDDKFDILIIAGDIADGATSVDMYMRRIIKQTNNPVLFVTGNHCRWGNYFHRANDILSSVPGYMNRTITEINGQRFLGCTLWYKLRENHLRSDWSDSRYILDYQTIDKEYQEDQDFLDKNLQENDIVVTHMLPSWNCVDAYYIGNPDNIYYVSDVEDLIIKRKPKLWVNGHSHKFMFKKLNNTLHLCNPMGYPRENSNYQWLIFDTEKNELRHVDAEI